MVTAALFAQGSWTLKASFPGTGRFDAVSFSVGTKGYFGTGNAGGYTADFWEWDQATNLWAQKANYPDTPRDRATGFSIGTKGYIACGYDLQWEDELWEYNPTTNTWVIRTPFANGLGRVSPVSFSIGNKGYVGMGYQNFHRQDIWEFDPMTNTWAQKANFGGPGRWHAVGFAIGGKGYVGTGDTALAGGQYGPKKDFWEYDPVANSWTRKADYGGPACSEATGFS
ncbi:MAG TPA: galactose oxidase, partial [Bacteroidia bacterium]|nr:galactose oxidase [Bacteroidia bacterium]